MGNAGDVSDAAGVSARGDLSDPGPEGEPKFLIWALEGT